MDDNEKYQGMLIGLAGRQFIENNSKLKSLYLPSREKLRLKEMNQSLEAELVQTLEEDKNGRLIVNLYPMENTAVNVRNREEADSLMQIYELSGWERRNGELPTTRNPWDRGGYEKETCASAGVDFFSKERGVFGHGSKKFYSQHGWNIILFKDFMTVNGIAPETEKAVNKYFETNFRDRVNV